MDGDGEKNPAFNTFKGRNSTRFELISHPLVKFPFELLLVSSLKT